MYVCVCLLAVAAVTAMTATCRLCVVNVFSKAFTTFSKFSMLCCNVVAAAAATASQRHRQFYSLPSLVYSQLVCSIVRIFVVRILFDNYCCCLFCFLFLLLLLCMPIKVWHLKCQAEGGFEVLQARLPASVSSDRVPGKMVAMNECVDS